MLGCMAALVQRMAGESVIVRFAHMELAEPSIERGVESCIAALVAAAAKAHPAVRVRVTPAFGIESELGEVILRRAGLDVFSRVNTGSECRCWQPEGRVGTCGDACPANAATRRSDSTRD